VLFDEVYPLKFVSPIAVLWSLSVQRKLSKNTIGTVAYSGSKGTDLTAETQINTLPPIPAADIRFR